MKIECFFVTGLAISQSGMLLGVAEEEFDLKSGRVIFEDFFGAGFDVGTEKQDVFLCGVVQQGDHQQFALEAHVVHHATVEVGSGVDLGNFSEPVLVDSLEFAIVFPLSASAFGVRSLVEITHIGILSESADEIDSDVAYPINEGLLAIKPVGDQVLDPLALCLLHAWTCLR